MRLPKTKLNIILIILTGLSLVFLVKWFFHKRQMSPGEIETMLSAGATLTDETLVALIDYFEAYELPDSACNKINADLQNNNFISKNDDALIQKIRALGEATATGETWHSFYRDNQYRLLQLIVQLLNHHLYLKRFHPQPVAQIEENLKLAEWLISSYPDSLERNFLQSELTFYQSLSGEELEKKLRLEYLAAQSYRLLQGKLTPVLQHLGAGLQTARAIKDRKREMDLLVALQFILNDRFGLSRTALALGANLLQKAAAWGYTIKTANIHFYNGHCHIDRGQYQQAFNEYQKAQTLYQNYNLESMIIRMYERMGVVNRRMGRFKPALKSYEQIFQLQKKADEKTARIDYLTGSGLVYAEMGKMDEADRLYRLAFSLAEQIGDKSRQAIALGNLGELYLDLGDSQQALDATRQAYRLVEAMDNPHTLVSLSINLIEILAANKQFEEAKRESEKTLALLSKFGFELLQAETYLSIGKLQLRIDDALTALTTFKKALAIAEQKGVVAQQLESFNMIAEAYRRASKLDSASQHIEKALQMLEQYPLAHHEWNTYFFLGRIHRDGGNITAAENHFTQSINKVKNLAAEIKNHEQRASFSEKIQPIFEEMALLQLAKNDAASAFRFTEEGRAQVFELLLQDSPNSEWAAETDAPPLPGNHASAFTVPNLQAQLTANEVVVEYEMTDSCLIIWVIGPETFHWAPAPITRDDIDRSIKQFRAYTDSDSLQTYAQLIRTYPKIAELCQRFYANLIDPIAVYLGDSTLIYFIPDETLNYLPFAAIIFPEDTFLIEKHPIVMIPSAEILYHLLLSKRSEPPANGKFLAVATNPDLTYSFEEVRSVASQYSNADSLIGPKFTERDVKEKLREPFEAILFSLHGKIDEKRPYLTSLVINANAPAAALSDDDGLLTLQEIQHLPLKATRLVYLSSCESASGRLYRGEGTVGLQRAFLIAGAHSIVANLWKIEDKRAKNQTVDYFKTWLGSEGSKALALQRAQRKFINNIRNEKHSPFDNLPHPCLWASVTLSGLAN